MVLSLDKTGVGLVGMGHATDTLAVGRRGKLTSFNSTKQAALKAYRMANVNPEDVDMAEIHDAFTAFEIIGSEDLGFFEPGQGARAAMDGKTARNGELPLNASGGLKARGHPVGASGLAQVVELVWQMRGQVEPERQLERTRVGLAQSIGGLANNNLVTILMRTDHRRTWQVSFEPNYHRELVPPRPLLEEEKRYYGRGELLTYTTLYSPPAGFKPPLDLGYVRMGDGAVILAHGQADPMPKLGEKVSVDVEGEALRLPQLRPRRGLASSSGQPGRHNLGLVGLWPEKRPGRSPIGRNRRGRQNRAEKPGQGPVPTSGQIAALFSRPASGLGKN